ncbi:LuxR C-terminal-related transcriptional regulator [Erwinia sp. Eh17-17]|uniref:helix-turn-helix transcriptional regulator n=1 Tax=Erwinia sp. Eh17-17 TaxID=3080330 RepID=UPI003209DC7E
MENYSITQQSLMMLIKFWEKSHEPWGAKDRSSTFIYANRKYCELLGLPPDFSVEGRLDGELPASTSCFQEQFQAHDRKVELLQDRVTSIEIHPFERHQWLQPWYFDKYPLFNEQGVCCGTIFHGRPVESVALASLEKFQMPTSLVFTPPSELFSVREWDIIFYTIHGFTSKEISKKLCLSQRTVSNYLQKIYNKAQVNNKRGLVDYCFAHNFNSYIPQGFFDRSLSLTSL